MALTMGKLSRCFVDKSSRVEVKHVHHFVPQPQSAQHSGR
jgi:hypothetical protein